MAPKPESGGESPESKADTQMVTQWRSRNAAQCKRIGAAVQNNLELQQLVLSTIESYENSMKIAKHQGSSVMDLTKKRKKHADRDLATVSDADKEVGKGKVVYKTWPKKWYSERLCFIEEELEPSVFESMPKDRLAEICERVLELQFLGDTPDRAKNTKNKKIDLFERLKALYMANGRVLQQVQDQFKQGYVNWETNGFYSIQVDDASGSTRLPAISLTCHVERKTILMNPDDMPDERGPFRIVNNYSLANAVVQGSRDSYRCQNYFTALGRRLKRNLSETLGLQDHLAKRAKPEAPAVPIDNGAPVAPAGPSAMGAAASVQNRAPPAEVAEDVPEGDD